MDFKVPRRTSPTSKNAKSQSIPVKDSSTETEEDSSSSDQDTNMEATQDLGMALDDAREAVFRSEATEWLALNGKALFALEVSRLLAKERKAGALKRTATLSKSGLLV